MISMSFQYIKWEVEVLKKLGNQKHFCNLIDWGENQAYNYMVMQLQGQNLKNLKKGTVNAKL